MAPRGCHGGEEVREDEASEARSPPSSTQGCVVLDFPECEKLLSVPPTEPLSLVKVGLDPMSVLELGGRWRLVKVTLDPSLFRRGSRTASLSSLPHAGRERGRERRTDLGR